MSNPVSFFGEIFKAVCSAGGSKRDLPVPQGAQLGCKLLR
jgi:hypothetical protein